MAVMTDVLSTDAIKTVNMGVGFTLNGPTLTVSLSIAVTFMELTIQGLEQQVLQRGACASHHLDHCQRLYDLLFLLLAMPALHATHALPHTPHTLFQALGSLVCLQCLHHQNRAAIVHGCS